MELLNPSVGLLFWTTIIFVAIVVLLKKMAWGPITTALRERENSIAEALEAAEKARIDMADLKSANEKILNEAKAERSKILSEANDVKTSIITEAKDKASEEAGKIIDNAKVEIENQKNLALTQIKDQVATLSLEIAEKILREQLGTQESQEKHIENLLQETH